MSSFGRLFLLLVTVPVLELALLVQIGRSVGLLPTLLLVILTGAVGAWLARAEGMRVVHAFQREASAGRVPGQALMDGACVLVGGVLLLTPGVLTDLLGLSLLLPLSRRWIQRRVGAGLDRRMREGSLRVVTFGMGRGFGPGSGFDGSEGADSPFGAGTAGERDLDPRKGIEVPPDR